MQLRVKIADCQLKPFKTDEGEEKEFYWTNGYREEDDVKIRIGGTISHMGDAGTVLELSLEKREGRNGSIWYREI